MVGMAQNAIGVEETSEHRWPQSIEHGVERAFVSWWDATGCRQGRRVIATRHSLVRSMFHIKSMPGKLHHLCDQLRA